MTEKDSAAPRNCSCGVVLPSGARGRPRRSCSVTCKRHRDNLLRKVERRRAWMALWRVGEYDAAEVAAAVDDLQHDITELLQALAEGPGVISHVDA